MGFVQAVRNGAPLFLAAEASAKAADCRAKVYFWHFIQKMATFSLKVGILHIRIQTMLSPLLSNLLCL
jgi:hypothetical protein